MIVMIVIVFMFKCFYGVQAGLSCICVGIIVIIACGVASAVFHWGSLHAIFVIITHIS